MSKRKISIIVVAVILIVVGIYILTIQSEKNITTPIEIETAKKLALERAKSHPLVDFRPEYASQSDIGHPLFKDYYFIIVKSKIGHLEVSYFAVSKEGSVFKLPEEFDQLVQDRGLKLATPDEAQRLLKFYLGFVLIPPPDQKLSLEEVALKDITDIPGVEKFEQITKKYSDLIKPMKVLSHAKGWMFEFFTWEAVGGVLSHWKINVSTDGKINIERKEQLEQRVGNYVMIE